MGDSNPPIFTIGHSTRKWQIFIDLLKEYEIGVLVDVRRFPSSKRYPHFNKGEMLTKLQEQQIEYSHLEALGGRREPVKESKNIGWHNKSFRGYADYMMSSGFLSGIEELIELYRVNRRLAIMCAEALPWRCHRMLISDYLTLLKGLEVNHILSSERLQRHSVTDFVRAIRDKKLLVYPDMSLVSSKK